MMATMVMTAMMAMMATTAMMATMVMMAMMATMVMTAMMVTTAMTMKARSCSAISLQLSTTAKKAALNVKRPIMKTTPKITGMSALTSLNSDTDTNVATKKTKASVVSMTSTACGPIQTLIPKRADLKTPPADPSTHTLLKTISSSPEKHQETRKRDSANMAANLTKNAETLG